MQRRKPACAGLVGHWHMIRALPAARLLLARLGCAGAMRNTLSGGPRATAASPSKREEDQQGLETAGTKAKARKGGGAAAATAAGAAAEAPAEAKRQRKQVAVPDLPGPPCFPAAASLVRVGTSGEWGLERHAGCRPVAFALLGRGAPGATPSLPSVQAGSTSTGAGRMAFTVVGVHRSTGPSRVRNAWVGSWLGDARAALPARRPSARPRRPAAAAGVGPLRAGV